MAAALATLLAVDVVLTGGFTAGSSVLRISAHDATRPFLAALVVGGVYFALYRRYFAIDAIGIASFRWPRIIGILATVAALLIGLELSAFMGAGPDMSGYVSQADLWAHGRPMMPVPAWALARAWENAVASAAPVGYTPDPRNTSFVPVYSPGLPLVMAAFQRIGGRDAVFYVVPLFGALAVWMTYVLGRRIGGTWGGAIAAVLTLSSPPFLWSLIEPMSDVPATACWTAAIVFAWRERKRDAVACGIVTAMAILIRPNLVPLTAVPAILLWISPDTRLRRLALFGLALAPAVLLIATLNWQWYGSPLKSGYGTLEALYSLKRVLPNVRLYGGWFIATQTPLAFLWLLTPYLVRPGRAEWMRIVVVTIVYPVAVFAMYAAYLSWESWLFLRFLLPAFPAVCAGLGAVFATFAREVRPRPMALAAVAAVTMSIAIQQWIFVSNSGFFGAAIGEGRFARAVEFANRLPPNAIVVSDSYSGTLHFYAGRDVIRWGAISPRQFDTALEYLHKGGHPVYFIGDPFEGRAFDDYLVRTDVPDRFEKGRLPDSGDLFVASNLTPP